MIRGAARKLALLAGLFVLLAHHGGAAVAATTADAQEAQTLIEDSLRRHRPPAHVFEEQTLVMTDRGGQHQLRTLRHYARRDALGTHALWVIETPVVARGSSIHVVRSADGKERHGASPRRTVFGSGFFVVDLEDEQVRDFRYEHIGDQEIERVSHIVLRATPVDPEVVRRTGYHERRIYLRRDNLFVSRIDYRDGAGELVRRQSFRDPRPGEAGAWWPGMILMEDLRDGERALLKIERRVHSPDYVPAAVFEQRRMEP